MSTYSTSLGLEEITPGDQAGLWGNTTNTNLSLIDQAIAGVTPVSLGSASGSTYVLTYYNGAVDESRSAVIKVTGTATGPNIIQIPAVQKLYVFRNSSGNTITVQTAAAANTVTLKDGEATLVFCDGANAYSGIATAGVGTVTVPYGGTGATSFGAGFIISPGGTGNLVSVPYIPLDASSAAVSGVLPVANGGTGQSTLASGAILTGNGTGNVTSLVGGTTGYVPTWNGSAWVSAAPSSAIYPGAGIAVSTGSSWTTSYSSGNPIPVSLGGTGATSFASAGLLTTSTGAQLSGATFSGAIGSNSNILTSGQIGLSGTGLNYARMVGSSVQLYDGNSSVYANQYGAVGIIANGYNPLAANGIGVGPGADNTYSLGGSSLKWTAVWAVNGAIQTSDARLKTDVTPSPLGLNFISKLNPVSYRWISGGNVEDGTTTPTQIGGDTVDIKNFKNKPGVRTHYGLLAQEVKNVLDQENVGDFAGWVLEDINDPNSPQGLNYAQFIAPLIKAVQELSAEVTALKSKVGT